MERCENHYHHHDHFQNCHHHRYHNHFIILTIIIGIIINIFNDVIFIITIAIIITSFINISTIIHYQNNKTPIKQHFCNSMRILQYDIKSYNASTNHHKISHFNHKGYNDLLFIKVIHRGNNLISQKR
jgi:hypothetical protein